MHTVFAGYVLLTCSATVPLEDMDTHYCPPWVAKFMDEETCPGCYTVTAGNKCENALCAYYRGA